MALAIKALTAKLLDTSWALAGEITTSASYKRRQPGSGTYDPATGAYIGSEQTAAVSAMLHHYKASEVDGTVIMPGDEKILVRQSEFTAINEPMPDDWFEISGIKRHVVSVKRDPTGKLYEFQVRRTDRKAAA